MRSRVSRGRQYAIPPVVLAGLSLLLIFVTPINAGTPHAAPAVAAPAAAAPAADPKAQISALRAAVTAGSDALKKTDDVLQDANAVQQNLQNQAAPAAAQSFSAQITALRGISSDADRVKDLHERLGEQDALTTALTALNKALNDDAKNSTDKDVVASVKSASDMQVKINQRAAAMTTLAGDKTVKGSLTAAVITLSGATKQLAGGIGTKITDDLAGAFADSAPAADRANLSRHMGELADLLTARARLRALLQVTPSEGPLRVSLKAAGAADSLPADSDLSASAEEKAAAAGLADRFQKMTQGLVGTGLSTPADVSAYAGRVQQAIRSHDAANVDVQNAEASLATIRTAASQLRQIVGSWTALNTAWLQDDPADRDALVNADLALAERTSDIAVIAEATDRINEALAGDMNDFVTDQVRLFYFTDVERIMQALSSTVRPVTEGQGDAQGKADQARQNLLDAEANVSQSLTAVNEAKTRLRTIQEDIRLVRARAADAQNRARTAQVLYNHLLQQQTELNRKAAADAANQPLQDESAHFDQRVKDAKDALDADASQKTASQTALDQLNDESAALPQKLLEARSDLSAARQTLDRQRALAAGLAELEAQAFANGRDHAPYLRSDARALSTDPARRVILLGYPDSDAIFVRGLSKDVETVKDMIAEFDRPAPQARITLWTLQVNGTDPQKLASIMQDIDQHLLLTRTLTGLVQDRLRDSLSYVVSHVQDKTALLMSLPPDDSTERLLRYQFYQPEILKRLGYDLPTPPLPPISGFPANLADLAVDDSYVTRFTIPDPAHGTTLGEMLFVISLGRKEYREAVLARFLHSLETIPAKLPGFGGHHDDLAMQQDRLTQFTQGLGIAVARNIVSEMEPLHPGRSTEQVRETLATEPVGAFTSDTAALATRLMLSSTEMAKLQPVLRGVRFPTVDDTRQSESNNTVSFFPRFPSTILGSFSDFGNPSPAVELTANQNEILLAVQAQARENVANEVKNLLQRMQPLTDALRHEPLGHQLRMQYLPLVGFLSTKYYSAQGSPAGLCWLQRGLLAVGALDKSKPANLQPLSLEECEAQVKGIESGTPPPAQAAVITEWEDIDRQAWQIASLSGQHNSLSRATPRVAAADDMIKRLIITIEDDLDYFFVQPELSAIRQETARQGIELGTFQRESLLATNRRVSRIDPRANADVELTGGTNFLEEASQLGQLYDRFRQEQTADKLTSSGPAVLAGTLSLLGDRAGSALGVGAALSVLGDLFTQPQPVGEIYSINSGSLFKVTPIFDPSGQALRFQFDYAGTTDVREPDGTTNPSIPRVERHTVNADVQLTNLELREVSRFEANSALGTPEQRTGGLPLLKHLPIFKDIPLIGYFARSAKKGAARQESLIFAQTSMYPTVADIVNLLVDIPPLSPGGRTEPEYLTAQDAGKTATASAEKPGVPQGGTKPVASAVAPPAGSGRISPGSSRISPGDVSDFIMPTGMQTR